MSSMYGGGYGSSYGGMYGGSRYGMGGMGMGAGMGMGMGMGMGGMDQQYSWLHSIQHFTSSLGYLTEVSRCCWKEVRPVRGEDCYQRRKLSCWQVSPEYVRSLREHC